MYARPPPCHTQFSHMKVFHSQWLFHPKELIACCGQEGRVQNSSVLIKETFSREKISVTPDRSINYGQISSPIILSTPRCQESSGPHPSLQTPQNGQRTPPVLTFPQCCSWMTNFSLPLHSVIIPYPPSPGVSLQAPVSSPKDTRQMAWWWSSSEGIILNNQHLQRRFFSGIRLHSDILRVRTKLQPLFWNQAAVNQWQFQHSHWCRTLQIAKEISEAIEKGQWELAEGENEKEIWVQCRRLQG